MLGPAFHTIAAASLLTISALAQSGTIQGEVYSSQTCIGIPSLTVSLVPPSRNFAQILTTTDEYGRFAITNAPLGASALLVSLGTGILSRLTVNVESNTVVNVPLSIDLPPGNGPSFQRAAKGLAKGSHGPEVQLLQTRLKERGYYSKEPDGYFGADLAVAVKRFQKEHKIQADGNTHKKSWLAIVCP